MTTPEPTEEVDKISPLAEGDVENVATPQAVESDVKAGAPVEAGQTSEPPSSAAAVSCCVHVISLLTLVIAVTVVRAMVTVTATMVGTTIAVAITMMRTVVGYRGPIADRLFFVRFLFV